MNQMGVISVMKHQVDQLEVFQEMTKAIDKGQTAKLRLADTVVRRALEENRRQHIRSSIFMLTDKDKALIRSLSL